MTIPIIPTPQGTRTRVLCVDDNPDIAIVLRLLIDSEPTMQCVGCLTSADDLVEEVHRQVPPPDVVLLDASMPGKDAFEAMEELFTGSPGTRAIMCSGHDDMAFIKRAMDAGAWGCVSKDAEPSTILRAVRAVASGSMWPPTRPAPGR